MQKKSNLFIMVIITVVAIAIGAFVLMSRNSGTPAQLDSFATCLKDKGTNFYGTFWCPHCQNQKELFGKSASLLPYVECSTPDGKGQLPICKERQVTSYPTWEFPGGARELGELSLQEIAEKSGCELPQQ